MSSNNYEIYKGYIESPLRSVKYDTYFPAYEKSFESYFFTNCLLSAHWCGIAK